MSGNLRQRRVAVDPAPFMMFIFAPGTDDQHPLGAQVNGRGDRRQLTHRAITKKLAMDFGGRKDEWDRAGGQKMVNADFGTDADTLDAMPGLRISMALKEIDVVAGFVTGG